jgi:hypothetical protein
MPIFKTNKNLFDPKDCGEYFDPNWMDSNKLILPPGGPDDLKFHWDYNRDMKIEDVDLWEVIIEGWARCGVYAAWLPYAEYYIIVHYGTVYKETPNGAWDGIIRSPIIDEFYGPNAQQRLVTRMKQLGIPVKLHEHWVDDDKMWIYA